MQPNLQVPSTLVLSWLLFLSHLCWKLFRFLFIHNNKQRRLMFIVAFGSKKTGCHNCCVSLPPTSWLLHPLPGSLLPLIIYRIILSRSGGILCCIASLHIINPVWRAAQTHHRPIFGQCGGCFVWATAKLMASLATEAREGISHGVGWLLWPSSDDLDWWWMDVFVVICAWKSTVLCMYSHKKTGFEQLSFFNSSLGDLKVRFVIKFPYFICRAWSALSKTVLTF
jgi:hypothetical protein